LTSGHCTRLPIESQCDGFGIFAVHVAASRAPGVPSARRLPNGPVGTPCSEASEGVEGRRSLFS
jgi:hypothetical protein